jgi:hypothetical protein
VVHLVVFFLGNKTFIQQTREPKPLQQDKTREGGGSLPLQMGEEHSCRGPKSHMVGTEVCTYKFNMPI